MMKAAEAFGAAIKDLESLKDTIKEAEETVEKSQGIIKECMEGNKALWEE